MRLFRFGNKKNPIQHEITCYGQKAKFQPKFLSTKHTYNPQNRQRFEFLTVECEFCIYLHYHLKRKDNLFTWKSYMGYRNLMTCQLNENVICWMRQYMSTVYTLYTVNLHVVCQNEVHLTYFKSLLLIYHNFLVFFLLSFSFHRVFSLVFVLV